VIIDAAAASDSITYTLGIEIYRYPLGTMSSESEEDTVGEDSISLDTFSFSSEGSSTVGPDAGDRIEVEPAAREDSGWFGLPNDDEVTWEWTNKEVVCLTDFTLSAHNAVPTVFNLEAEQKLYTPLMCARHAGAGWLSNTKRSAFLNDRDGNLQSMSHDFDQYV